MTAELHARAGLLHDILVVEIGERIAVGACGGLLAQLGASVVAIEPSIATEAGKWRNRAAMMAGKQSVVLAASRGDDDALRARLLAAADVLLLSSDTSSHDEALWAAPRPRTQVLCDITAFGHDGPLAGRGGNDAAIQAYTGVADTTGRQDGPPSLVGTPVLEMSTAVFAASAILAALRVRRLHGDGQRIDMAIFDTAVNQLINFLPLHFADRPATRSGNRHPLHVPWGSYRARDGYVLVCSVTGDQFTRICQAIGEPELATDPRFATAGARLQNFREIDERISAWAAGRTVSECESVMLALGVACGPIVLVDALEHDRNLVHRAMVRRLRDPSSGEMVAVPSSPIRGDPIGGIAPDAIPARDESQAAIARLLATRDDRRQAPVTGDAASSRLPLQGVRVIEIGQYTVAPLASRHLGALGADVIKIEPPQGDAIRKAAPLRSDGEAHIFALSNTDKRGLVLDLRDENQRQMLHTLLARADVLIENLRPGALAKLGFGSAQIRQSHPHLIYASVNGFGNDSAYPERPALDTVIQAMSGLMGLTQVDGKPTKAGISASDVLGGEFGLLAVLAGLECRDRTGTAIHFDLSMQDASAWMTQMDWPSSSPPSSVTMLKASDGFVIAEADSVTVDSTLGVSSQGPFERDALVSALLSAGIEAAPVLTVSEVVAHAQVAARQLLIERPTRDGSAWTVLGSPLRLLTTPPKVRSVMSRLGAENAEIIAEFALVASRSALPSEPMPLDHRIHQGNP